MIVLIGIIGTLILGVIVFGGGQAFMPLFGSLWKLMGMNQNTIENIYTVVNSTPGVVGTQFSLFTGYFAANGEWYGYLLMLVTYLMFFIPSAVMIIYSYKTITKLNDSKYLKNIVVWLKPVIIGIVLSIAIQLFISTAFPQIVFNGNEKYIGKSFSLKSIFADGWRMYAAIFYSIIVVCETFYLYHVKKVSFLSLIISHILLGLIVFEPWLN